MKLFSITLSFIVMANALAYVPSWQRVRRDVSELKPQNTYLAPPSEFDISAEAVPDISATELPETQDSAVLTENGYEYKSVRKLGFRNRRDVSHLKSHYLPPKNEYLPPIKVKDSEMSKEQHQQPSKVFLPPVNEQQSEIPAEKTQPSNEYLPPVNEKELNISPEEHQPSNEYLPPADVKETKETASETPQPSNQYIPPAKLEEEEISEPETSTKSIGNIEPEAEDPEIVTIAPVEELDTINEIPQDTAVLLDDGYHYRAPSDIPNLFSPSTLPSEEFLAPLDGESFEVEGPSNGESAILAEDGYHYRAIKRRV